LWYLTHMSLTAKDIDRLAELSRLDLSEAEKEKYLKDFEAILAYVSEISKVAGTSSDEKPPLLNVFREDTVTTKTGSFTQAFLEQAPETEGDYVKVKQVF
jgi:aspartyl-tRNA(Asn)/glutamyl-tRNA(Gln) amidotransferase subunit C